MSAGSAIPKSAVICFASAARRSMTRWARSVGIVDGLLAGDAEVIASLTQASSAGSQMAVRSLALTLMNPGGIVICQRTRRVVAGAVALVVADVAGTVCAAALAVTIPTAKKEANLCIIAKQSLRRIAKKKNMRCIFALGNGI